MERKTRVGLERVIFEKEKNPQFPIFSILYLEKGKLKKPCLSCRVQVFFTVVHILVHWFIFSFFPFPT